MFGTRGGKASRSARQSDGFSGSRPIKIYGTCAKCYLSIATRLERRAYLAGSWMDGYRYALRYGDYADVGVYDFGGECEGEVGE